MGGKGGEESEAERDATKPEGVRSQRCMYFFMLLVRGGVGECETKVHTKYLGTTI